MSPETYVHATTYLHLSSWRHVPAFLEATRAVDRALHELSGYVAHDRRANILIKVFRTYSIYEDHAALARLLATQEHQRAVSMFPVWGLPDSKFISWESASDRIDWKAADRKLQQAPPLGPGRSR